MIVPFNLTQEKALRAIGRDAAGRPAMAASSPAELTLLTLATRISPTIVMQVDLGQLTEVAGATSAQRAAVHFPCAGNVIRLAFVEVETGVVRDQEFQINTTQGADSPLGYDQEMNEDEINAEAFFGADRREREVAYHIRGKDDTWSVTLRNLRAAATSHPVLMIEFLPDEPLGLTERR